MLNILSASLQKAKLVLLKPQNLHCNSGALCYSSSLFPLTPPPFRLSPFLPLVQTSTVTQLPVTRTPNQPSQYLVSCPPCSNVMKRILGPYSENVWVTWSLNSQRKRLIWCGLGLPVSQCITTCVHVYSERTELSLCTFFHEQSSHSGSRVTGSRLNSCMTSWFSSSRHTVIW